MCQWTSFKFSVIKLFSQSFGELTRCSQNMSCGQCEVSKHLAYRHIYRLQRSCGQGNIFTPVCHSVKRWGVGVGFCLSACWETTPQTRPPPEQTPPPLRVDTPPGADTSPQSRPPEQTPGTRPPQDQTPPGPDPPGKADSSIWSTSGRYASYWNAFLFKINCEETGREKPKIQFF